MREKLWYVKQCDLFTQLSSDQLDQVEQHCRIRMFSRGETIYMPVERADSVLLVATGMVKLCNMTSEGKEAILAFIEPGELFGELSFLGESSRGEMAVAVEKTKIVLIAREMFERLVESSPRFSLGVTKLFGLRRQRIERRLTFLLFRSSKERLVHLLLELVDQFGEMHEEGIRLRIKLTHQDVASIIGSTRETATLLLGEFQESGLVKLARRQIIVTDRHRLQALLEQ